MKLFKKKYRKDEKLHKIMGVETRSPEKWVLVNTEELANFNGGCYKHRGCLTLLTIAEMREMAKLLNETVEKLESNEFTKEWAKG